MSTVDSTQCECGRWRDGITVCPVHPEVQMSVEQAEAALREFKRTVQEGHPWVPGLIFILNPGLDLYIMAALERWAEDQRNRLPIVSGTLTDEEISEIVEGAQERLW
jgi:hypothetical protein